MVSVWHVSHSFVYVFSAVLETKTNLKFDKFAKNFKSKVSKIYSKVWCVLAHTPCLKKLCIFVSVRTSSNFHEF